LGFAKDILKDDLNYNPKFFLDTIDSHQVISTKGFIYSIQMEEESSFTPGGEEQWIERNSWGS
jgi:hypothetical protein